jgi:hypothetical protein
MVEFKYVPSNNMTFLVQKRPRKNEHRSYRADLAKNNSKNKCQILGKLFFSK